jgi:hypothetical protein
VCTLPQYIYIVVLYYSVGLTAKARLSHMKNTKDKIIFSQEKNFLCVYFKHLHIVNNYITVKYKEEE